jgi:putative transcriptional regulator
LLEWTLAGEPGAAPREHAQVDAHVAACRDCAAARAELARLAGDLADALVAPERAPASLRERLLFETRAGRALPTFAAGVAKLLDLDEAKARAALEALARPESWGPGLCPGNVMRPIRPGPALGPGVMAGFLKTAPGTTLPMHRHLGRETTFVLQGGYRDSTGLEVWAGEQTTLDGGSSHDLLVLPDVDCITLVISHGGFVRD